MYDEERQQEETYYTVITYVINAVFSSRYRLYRSETRHILGFFFLPPLSSSSVSQCSLSLTLHPFLSQFVSLSEFICRYVWLNH